MRLRFQAKRSKHYDAAIGKQVIRALLNRFLLLEIARNGEINILEIRLGHIVRANEILWMVQAWRILLG